MMDIRIDKMQYQTNKISYWLGFLALALDVIYVLRAISILTPSMTVAIKILLNIILMLLTFLAMEQVKNYSKKFSVVLIVCGIISFLRFFYVPLELLNGQIVQINGDVYPFSEFIKMATYLLIMGISYISSGVIAYRKHSILKEYVQKKEVLVEVHSE